MIARSLGRGCPLRPCRIVLASVEFEWDPIKASSNVAKHGIDFYTATEIFEDPDLFVIVDSRVYSERR